VPEARPWARCRAPSCWDRSVLWQVHSSDTPRDRRSRAPGECSEPRRDPAQRMQHDPALHLNNRRRPPQVRRRRSGLRRSPPKALRCHRFRDLNRKPADESARPPGHLTRRGKSPAYLSSSQEFKSPRRETGRRSPAANVPSPNLLDRQFAAERPNQKWIADFTYIARSRVGSTYRL